MSTQDANYTSGTTDAADTRVGTEMQGAVATDNDPRPITHVANAYYADRADMLFENSPQRSAIEAVIYVWEALSKGATEVKIRLCPTRKET